MPKVEDIFSKLNGVTYFTTLDLCTGYHHIPLDKSSIPKTAFNSPFRKYEYVKILLGLAEAPAYFQELMTSILLCNPKFVYKNNWYFGLSSTYFLYPLTSLPKMVKQEMPASVK